MHCDTARSPLYFAAQGDGTCGARWRLLVFVAAPPIFIALGIARLLVVALRQR